LLLYVVFLGGNKNITIYSNTVFMAKCHHQKWNEVTGIWRRIVWG